MTILRKIGGNSDRPVNKTSLSWTQDASDSVEYLFGLNGGRLTGVGGSANAITASLAIDDNFSSYPDGFEVQFIATASNTGSATINIENIGAKAIKSTSGGALPAGSIVSGNLVILKFNSAGDHFRLTASGGTQNVTIQGGLTVKRSAASRTLATISSTTALSVIVSRSFQTRFSASRVIVKGAVMLKTASGTDDFDGLVVSLYVDNTQRATFSTISWSNQAYLVPFDFEYLPADTSTHTYQIRVSSTNAAVYPVNGSQIICEEWGVNP